MEPTSQKKGASFPSPHLFVSRLFPLFYSVGPCFASTPFPARFASFPVSSLYRGNGKRDTRKYEAGADTGASSNTRGAGARLARMLKPFGILAHSIRLDDGSTPKGYKRDSFADAWARYLP